MYAGSSEPIKKYKFSECINEVIQYTSTRIAFQVITTTFMNVDTAITILDSNNTLLKSCDMYTCPYNAIRDKFPLFRR